MKRHGGISSASIRRVRHERYGLKPIRSVLTNWPILPEIFWGSRGRSLRALVRGRPTTLNIDDKVMADLRREAARQGRTMSELVESALRLLLRSQRKQQRIAPLPTFHSGGAFVDIADRNALYQAMEGR